MSARGIQTSVAGAGSVPVTPSTRRWALKLQRLSRETSTPVSTIKFYLREQLLPPGRKLNATTAAYGTEHVDRLDLIRALRHEVGLGLDGVRQVVEAVETLDPIRMMGRVQAIVLDLSAEPAVTGPGESPTRGESMAPGESPKRGVRSTSGHNGRSGSDSGDADTYAAAGALTAQDVIDEMGWHPGTPESMRALDDQLATMSAWGLAPNLDTALVYARAVDTVAAYELSAGAPWAGRPGGDRPSSGPPSADRMAAYTAVGVHGYSQLLLRLLSVAQGSHARSLDRSAMIERAQAWAPGSPD